MLKFAGIEFLKKVLGDRQVRHANMVNQPRHSEQPYTLYLRPDARKSASPLLRLGRIGNHRLIAVLVQTGFHANVIVIGYGKGGNTISMVAAKDKRGDAYRGERRRRH
jgi:hypothetical protein